MARRDSGRRSKKKRDHQIGLNMPVHQPTLSFAPVEILTAEQVEDIHKASLKVLQNTGIHFMGRAAREFLAGFDGIKVDHESEIVRFAPDVVEHAMASVPRTFRLHARNSDKDLEFGVGKIAFTNVVTPPYVEDAERGQRNGTHAEMEQLIRLMQMIDAVGMFYGYPVEPQDLEPATRHLDSYRSHAVLSDKLWRCYTLGDDRVLDAIEMARIARGVDAETNQREPSVLGNVTTNSPLRIDEPMGDGLMMMGAAGQPVSITCFGMAGAISPITLAGALAQQNAEILAAATLSQLANPGAPLIYGAFTSSVSMRSGAIAFGNSEFVQLTIAGAQLARRYGMPYKTAGATTSKVVDAQAAYETQMAMWAGIVSGADVMVHAAGFMESALTVNYEKLIVDTEMIQMLAAMMKPIDCSAKALALDVIHDIGPGGNFFSHPHTLDRYETEFHEPFLSDWDNRQNWVERGGLATHERATRIWKGLLQNYEEPTLDAAIREELDDYVARRRREIIVTAA